MKTNSKKFWLENNIKLINITTIVLYGLTFWLNNKFDIILPLQAISLFYLSILTPLNVVLLFKINLTDYLEYFFSILVVFFTLYIPLYFIANYFFNFSFKETNTLLINIFISFLTIIRQAQPLNATPISSFKFTKRTFYSILNLSKRHWPIILIGLLFGLMHLINFHFYHFMPEWDSYSNLVEIKQIIKTNSIENNYRGFFTTSVVVISNFTHIKPYTLFTSLFIILQFNLYLVLYQLLKKIKITKKIHQFILLFGGLGVPVLNLEIDVTRPQTIFVILFPLYIYFLYQSLQTRKYSYYFLTLLLIIFSLNYHEFFFLLPISLGIIIFILFLNNRHKFIKLDVAKKIFFLSIILNLFLLFLLTAQHFNILQYPLFIGKNILFKILDYHNWRWWFLGNYSGDLSGLQLGWPGISGAFKYYSYYLSPANLLFLLFLLWLIIKRKVSLKNNVLFQVIIPLLLFLLFYAEILPRLGFIWLPERTWLIIDVLFILSGPAFFKYTSNKYSNFTGKFLMAFSILSIVGFLATFYLASQKQALTSVNEFKVATWIKNNTPKNTLFISQSANGPMINYFAERKMLKGDYSDFFKSPRKIDPSQIIKTPQQQKNTLYNNLKNNLKNIQIADLSDIQQMLQRLKQAKKQISILDKKQKKDSSSPNDPLYVLYSQDKLAGLYTTRDWWLKTNYHDANLKAISKIYPLVYNKNGIYIWKVK